MTCHKMVPVKGGACLASTRPCSYKVAYTDHLGRNWCKRHQPDEETRERWNLIAETIKKNAGEGR